MLKKLRKNKKGFTLAELLIVVAIIGVLVAISIPIFTNQLEKSREATDAANIRNAIADISVDYLSDDVVPDDGYEIVVDLKQQKDGWQSTGIEFLDSKGKSVNGSNGTPKKDGNCTVKMSAAGVLSMEFST